VTRFCNGLATTREVCNKRLMKALILLVGWCILFVLCWPVALLALVLFPFVWLISLPLRLLGLTLEAVFALLRGLLFLPARLLGQEIKRWLRISLPPLCYGLALRDRKSVV
jgi:hypothetical protein